MTATAKANKVKIHKVEITESFSMAEQDEGYSLSEWGDNTSYYSGSDDGGEWYELPERYTVEEFDFGVREIREDGSRCVLGVAYNGAPLLMGQTFTVLKKLEGEE